MFSKSIPIGLRILKAASAATTELLTAACIQIKVVSDSRWGWKFFAYFFIKFPVVFKNPLILVLAAFVNSFVTALAVFFQENRQELILHKIFEKKLFKKKIL